jgi:hypothetical protein
VGGGGDGAGAVAEVVLDLAEGLVVGEVDQALGHLAQLRLGPLAEGGQPGLDAGFTVIGGRRRGRSGGS